MTVRVGINGFGRIGRNFLRALLEDDEQDGGSSQVELVAVNDMVPREVSIHLLRYDSTHGRLQQPLEETEKGFRVGRHEVAVLSEREPKELGWGDLGVDVVIESTGRFTSRDAAMTHVEAGAKRVIISAPAKDADATFVIGVNDQDFDPERHVVVSNASCTTNCLVPMVRVIDDAFDLRQGLMTTVHAYTNDQELLDLGRDNLRRARAAAINVVPAATGAARATSLVLPAMKGRLDGQSLRVPVADGSITDLTAIVGAAVDARQVNEAFRNASTDGPLSGVLEYSEDQIVSSDIVGSRASCTFDSTLTMVVPVDDSSTLLKAFGWYDNEWGYSHRLIDLAEVVGRA
jgi:glyceraldehyde 3-phosphate dehydrogenase